MIHAVVVVQDLFAGYTHIHTNQNEYFQNFEVYIGNSPDYSQNPKCPGGPFMTLAPGSDGWYYDERTNNSRLPAEVWTYGKEIWCNMPGRFVNIVANLKHLTPPYLMSLCSIGLMGASYVRDEPLTEVIEVTQGQQVSFSVAHIYDEHTNGEVPLAVNLRQAAGAADTLSFVSLVESESASVVAIDASSTPVGNYTLRLESFDSLSPIKTTLRADQVTIVVLLAEPWLDLPSRQLPPTEPFSWPVVSQSDISDFVIELEVPT